VIKVAERKPVIYRPGQEPEEVVILDNGEGYPSDHTKVEIIYETSKSSQ
jgi:hypothetical protein